MILYKKFLNLLEFFHVLVFKRESGKAMKNFIDNLSLSFIGFFFSSFVLFSLNIIVGRFLGPTDYGRYNLLLVIANIISIFILLGLNVSTTRFLAEDKSDIEKKKIISNSVIAVSLSSLFFLCVFWIMFYQDVFRDFEVEPFLIFVALIFAILLSYKSLFDGISKGLNLFKYQTGLRIMESIFTAGVFSIFFLKYNFDNFYYYAASLMAGMTFFCLSFYFKIKKYIIGWSWHHFRKIYRYTGNTIIISIILIAVSYLDRIFVGKFIGMTELGIYSAYLTSSSVFVGQIMLILNNVFFPAVVSLKDKRSIKNQLDRLFLFLSLPAFLFFFITTYVFLYFFGKEFERNVFFIILFSFAAMLQLFGSLYKSLVSSHNERYKKYMKFSYTLPFFLMFVYALMIAFDFRKIIYAVVAYVAFVSYNFYIIHLSCNYEKK